MCLLLVKFALFCYLESNRSIFTFTSFPVDQIEGKKKEIKRKNGCPLSSLDSKIDFNCQNYNLLEIIIDC